MSEAPSGKAPSRRKSVEAIRRECETAAMHRTLGPFQLVMIGIGCIVGAGVFVMTGTDSVIDHWSPFGNGDMLDKACLYAQLYRGSDEYQLSRSLAISTGGVLPLDNDGNRAWPKVGDEASFSLAEANCTAEAVARVSSRTATFHKGRLVSGDIGKASG